MDAPAWSLHPQLAADTIEVGDLSLCRVLLMDDAQYPWLILAPRRDGLVEITDLNEAERTQAMAEIALAAEALKRLTRCDKLNIAALGNAVPQLHVHVIARFRNDLAWPAPVWGKLPPRRYEAPERDSLLAALRAELSCS